MKYPLLLFFSSLLLFSCETNMQSKCNDKIVKLNALKLFKEKIKPVLLDELIEKEINISDIRNYAWDNNLKFEDVLKDEKKRIANEYDSLINSKLDETVLRNIRTEKLEREIGKCSCVGEVENENLNPISLYYTAQKTEDNGVQFVEINYTVNE